MHTEFSPSPQNRLQSICLALNKVYNLYQVVRKVGIQDLIDYTIL